MPGTHSAYLKPPRPWKNIKDESVLPKSSIRPVPVEDFTPPIVVESRDWRMIMTQKMLSNLTKQNVRAKETDQHNAWSRCESYLLPQRLFYAHS